ncbi:hypothetical protein ACFX13_039127 [Malus domestica]
MKSNIGVVGTSSAVMMVMIFLLITGSAMANEKCRQRCYGGCGLPPTAECIEECQKKCGNNAQPQSLADQVTQYCKLGCSLHRCSKYKNDESKLENCVGRCSNKYCNIKHLN